MHWLIAGRHRRRRQSFHPPSRATVPLEMSPTPDTSLTLKREMLITKDNCLERFVLIYIFIHFLKYNSLLQSYILTFPPKLRSTNFKSKRIQLKNNCFRVTIHVTHCTNFRSRFVYIFRLS